jgi:hypothetical protein
MLKAALTTSFRYKVLPNLAMYPDAREASRLAFMSIVARRYAGYVVVRVVRADFYSGTQKTVQCLLVLLLPLFGAALVHWFLRLQDSKAEKSDRAFIPQREPNIDDLRGLH